MVVTGVRRAAVRGGDAFEHESEVAGSLRCEIDVGGDAVGVVDEVCDGGAAEVAEAEAEVEGAGDDDGVGLAQRHRPHG